MAKVRNVDDFQKGSAVCAPVPFSRIVVSLILIYFGWHHLIPPALTKPIKMFGDCALPMAVLVVGGNLATIDIFGTNKKEIFLAVFA